MGVKESTKYREIRCPICNKGKFIDVGNSRGKNSVACNKCGRFLILDWDKMIATAGATIKQGC